MVAAIFGAIFWMIVIILALIYTPLGLWAFVVVMFAGNAIMHIYKKDNWLAVVLSSALAILVIWIAFR